MKIAIVIPTYKRINKLKRCLESIYNQTYKEFDIFVYCDNNDSETYSWLIENHLDKVKVNINRTQEFVIGSWNKFFSSEHLKFYDAVAWIVDDVELYPDYLERLVADMNRLFPDLDGVIGATQVCPGRKEYTYKPYGQVLIGKKFIERYKEINYQVCCPDFNHFWQDCEMWEYATSLNKFYHSQGAVLKHYHPAFLSNEMDETHPLVRGKIKSQDDETYKKRKKLNLIWGREFTLINAM